MINSTLFFNDFTCIDHAIINDKGDIVGGSFHPVVEVSGNVTDDESVVVDFSSGKARMKGVIDDAFIGLDHHLVVIDGYSDCTIEYNVMLGGARHTRIVTSKLDITVPYCDVIVIENVNDDVKASFENYIEYLLSTNMSEFKFKCTLNQRPHLFNPDNKIQPIMFRYVHGLKNSTSYGCKNIAHGHLSFFEITESQYRKSCNDCQRGIANIREWFEKLGYNLMFVNAENVVSRNGRMITIMYQTGRGMMRIEIKDPGYRYIELGSETTIEHLAEFIKHEIMGDLMLAKVRQFRISEGLQKGVVVNV